MSAARIDAAGAAFVEFVEQFDGARRRRLHSGGRLKAILEQT
jgi:hypothetical protein